MSAVGNNVGVRYPRRQLALPLNVSGGEGRMSMRRNLRGFAAAAVLAMAAAAPQLASAQKSGGILRIPALDSPASMSIHEESTIAVLGPMMGVFNNLVMFDQHVKQNSLDSIVPELAAGWSWNEEGTNLTFALRRGVKWHDGKPFTARDVKCPGA